MMVASLSIAALLTGAVSASMGSNDSRNLIIGALDILDAYRYFTLLEAGGSFCGASLIAPDMLLTAAQCSPLSANQPSIGYFSSADVSEVIAIEQVFVHPGFDPITISYDFQVVKLASSATADIIRLNGDPTVPSGELLSVLGIGDTDAGQGFGGDLSVKGGIINLQDNTACAAFKGNSASYSGSIYDSMLCAFGTSTNACQGDNGGPLVAGNINDPSIPDALVGVVSWGYDSCAGSNVFPRVFSRVSAGYDWIRFILCTESSSPPPAYLGCNANEMAPPVPSIPSPPAATNPITFRYSFSTDGFAYQNGVRIESVGGNTVETIQHVVPTALPNSGTFTQTLALSERELYSFTMTDSFGNGIMSDIQITLSLEDPNGNFVPIETSTAGFSDALVLHFYATLDDIEEFEDPKEFAGGRSLALEMTFDEFPEEVSILLVSGTEEIWYRPFRFYTNEAATTITETIPIPDELRSYTLTVRDSAGDGLGSAAYTVSSNGQMLVESTFDSGGVDSNSFTFNPSETLPPFTPTPTVVTPRDTPATGSPTAAPSAASSLRAGLLSVLLLIPAFL